MASIGAVQCDYLYDSARPPEIEEGVETWLRPGVDGIGSRTTGERGGAFVLRAVRIAPAADIETWLASLAALAGSGAVTVTLDSGREYDGCHLGRPEGRAVALVSYRAGLVEGSAVVIAEAAVHGWRS